MTPPDTAIARLARRSGAFLRAGYALALPALVRRPPRVAGALPGRVVAFSGEADLPEQVASIRSLLAHAGRPRAFTVVSDGSHTPRARALLRAVDPCVEVVALADVVRGDLPGAVARLAGAEPMMDKLALELSLLDRPGDEPVVYADSDVLFLPGAAALADTLRAPGPPRYLRDEEPYLDARLLDDGERERPPVNGGFWVAWAPLRWEAALARLERVAEPVFHSEQTLLHLAMHASGAVALDPGRHVVATDDMREWRDRHASPGLVLRHYTTPVRHKLWLAVARPRGAPRAGAMPPPAPAAPQVDLSVVLPTFNRAPALRETVPALLALDGVGEVVVVDDGSTDATPEVLASLAHPRLRIVRLARNGGAPAARNAGVRAARGRWVLFGEDDCRFPPDYARVLREEADAHGADVVGAPMVHPAPGQSLDAAVAAARARGRSEGIDAVAGFPAAPLVTPFLQAPSLVRRDLALRIGFDARYGGNGYREESDFFLRAAGSGVVCLLTPRTYFWEPRRWPGGQADRAKLTGELWTLRNNWRFLRRHGRWLAAEGHIRSPAAEQTAFALRRARRRAGSLAGE